TASSVEQDIVRVKGKERIEVLHELLSRPEFEKVLVFGRTKHGVERLSKMLVQRGFKAASIHGNKSQNHRERALRAFKGNEIAVVRCSCGNKYIKTRDEQSCCLRCLMKNGTLRPQ